MNTHKQSTLISNHFIAYVVYIDNHGIYVMAEPATKGQPPNNGQNACPSLCPLFGGSTVYVQFLASNNSMKNIIIPASCLPSSYTGSMLWLKRSHAKLSMLSIASKTTC